MLIKVSAEWIPPMFKNILFYMDLVLVHMSKKCILSGSPNTTCVIRLSFVNVSTNDTYVK